MCQNAIEIHGNFDKSVKAGAHHQERSSSLLDLYPSTVADGAIFNSVWRQRKQINYYADQSTCANSMYFR